MLIHLSSIGEKIGALGALVRGREMAYCKSSFLASLVIFSRLKTIDFVVEEF